jgi:hypothetical protein
MSKEIKQENKEQAPVTAPVEQQAAPPKPKLADGLFKEFLVGSRLAAGSTGNVMTNVKTSPMDYQKRYESSTKNQKLTAEDIAKLKPDTIKNPVDKKPAKA